MESHEQNMNGSVSKWKGRVWYNGRRWTTRINEKE